MEGEKKRKAEEGERGLTSTSLDCSLHPGPCPQHWAVSLLRMSFCVVFVCSGTCGLVSSLNRSKTKETVLPGGPEDSMVLSKPGAF